MNRILLSKLAIVPLIFVHHAIAARATTLSGTELRRKQLALTREND